jgi:hypothetical protein
MRIYVYGLVSARRFGTRLDLAMRLVLIQAAVGGLSKYWLWQGECIIQFALLEFELLTLLLISKGGG